MIACGFLHARAAGRLRTANNGNAFAFTCASPLSPSSLYRAVLSAGLSGLSSSPYIADQYQYVPMAHRSSFFSAARAQYIAHQARSVMRTSMAIAQVQQRLGGAGKFSVSEFKQTAEDIFSRFMNAHAAGSISALHVVATDPIVASLQIEINQRAPGSSGEGEGRGSGVRGGRSKKRSGGAKGRNGSVTAPHTTMRVLKFVGRTEVCAATPSDDNASENHAAARLFLLHLLATHTTIVSFLSCCSAPQVLQVRHYQKWGQVTCKIQSQRERRRVGTDGLFVGVAEFTNLSICVFEVCFDDPTATWRVAHIHEISEP